MVGLDALQTMLRMRGPSNVSAMPSRRSLDVLTGDDQFEPSEAELIAAQNAEGVGKFSDGGVVAGLSREQLRDSAMQGLRRTLGLKSIEHQQEMEAAERPLHIKGRYEVEAATRSAEAAMDRVLQQQQGQDRRTAAQVDSRMGLQNDQQQHQAGMQEDRQAAMAARPQTSVPQALYKAVEDARTQRGGLINRIQRATRIGDDGTNAYASALLAVLDRQGLSRAAQAALADVQNGGTLTAEDEAFLGPYAMEYIKLKTGQ